MEGKIILLVEDNPNDVKLTQRAMKKAMIKNPLVVARDGEEALDYLFGTGKYADRDASVLPVLVLLDLKLPKMDGLDVLKRIRAVSRTKLIPVVILTSSTEPRDLVESYASGCNSYIRKSVNFDQFIEVIQQLVLYWLYRNQAPLGGKEV